MYSFLLNFLVTHLGFSCILFLWLVRFNSANAHSQKALLLYALGLGPAITSLVTYYSFWLLPGHTDGFYFGIVLGTFIALLLPVLRYLPALRNTLIAYWNMLAKAITFPFKRTNWSQLTQKGGGAHWLGAETIVLGGFLLFAAYWVYLLLFSPITGHDMLEYTIQADYFHETKALTYQAHHYNEATGFYYVGLHGWSFQLLHTWERIWDGVVGLQYDLYFKTLTGYYSLLILGLMYYWLRQKSQVLANLGVAFLMLTYGYFITSYNFHIDTYRIFFALMVFIWTLSAVEYADKTSFVGLAVFGGTAAFAHSLGVFILCFALFTLLLFLRGNIFKQRLPILAAIAIGALACGGIHYLVDVFAGTGWIFKEIKFY